MSITLASTVDVRHLELQIGYLVGPPALIAAIAKAHQFVVFTVPSSLQRAVAFGLDNEEQFYR